MSEPTPPQPTPATPPPPPAPAKPAPAPAQPAPAPAAPASASPGEPASLGQRIRGGARGLVLPVLAIFSALVIGAIVIVVFLPSFSSRSFIRTLQASRLMPLNAAAL